MKTITHFKILLVFLFMIFLFSCKTSKASAESSEFNHLKLRQFSQKQLTEDFNLLVNSLKEAHTGLYWYSTEAQFDSVVSAQKSLIKDQLNELQFYNIVAPIIAFTKEDHCDLALSDKTLHELKTNGLFLPLILIHLDEQPYILNNPNSAINLKGFILHSINGVPVKEIQQKIFNTFAADGYIESSKYRYLDLRGFAREYAKVIGQKGENNITVIHPVTQQTFTYNLPSVSNAELIQLQKNVLHSNKIRKEIIPPAQLTYIRETPVLTFRTFSNSTFEKYQMNFKRFVDSAFTVILSKPEKNLIIDIRDNGGGSEGNEDYLFSYLADQPYHKYKHVKASRLNFSFLKHTDYSKRKDQKDLQKELIEENQLSPDGNYYRKPGIYIPEPVKSNAFKGQVYVLTSGWTYSGGAEFSTLMKEHTQAIFIGEETGGGYDGNTSGTSFTLTLPHTKLDIEIPILQFVLDVQKGLFGRGVIPQYELQPTFDEFINGYDTELEKALELIEKHQE